VSWMDQLSWMEQLSWMDQLSWMNQSDLLSGALLCQELALQRPPLPPEPAWSSASASSWPSWQLLWQLLDSPQQLAAQQLRTHQHARSPEVEMPAQHPVVQKGLNCMPCFNGKQHVVCRDKVMAQWYACKLLYSHTYDQCTAQAH